MKTKWLAAALLGAVALHPARAAHADQDLVDRARLTLNDVERDPAFGNARSLLRRAQAVMIVPQLFKGGFFVGGEGGTGVLLARQLDQWSQPAFYTLASASLGFQIGAQQSELVLIIMTDRGKRAFMENRFKLGAEAGLTVVTIGSSAEAATASNLQPDIVAWSSSQGAYAGVTLKGSVIEPRESYDQHYYGRDVSSYGIVTLNQVRNRGADGLRQKLLDMAGP
jgi:SH3 domain-containing YSC84-like protein 1